VCAIHKSSCFSRCLRVPIAMRRFYKPSLWIPQLFLFTNPNLHHGLLNMVFFGATKLEAFGGRGKNDYLSSHDPNGRRDGVMSVFNANTGHGCVNESKRNHRPLLHI
jgi:hypothetical protein